METVQEVAAENQAYSHPRENQERKVGLEIVRSVALASEFFQGPRPGRHFPNRARVWRAKAAR
jgi:hypothetical protein